MAKILKSEASIFSPKEHISILIDWMSQGVYEKEHIIAMALLCTIAGENIFLLGPPGTAKSMVAARLKMVFKDAKSFDYLMSRFSTPDEIFGPISISRLKNDDRYERLTNGYLPDADIVFLDEIWKAGPSIQNTLLTVINEHVFYNGGRRIKTPMKVLIAASNELPAKDEGLEALWDRFLVRMVSNCIESDSAFFKMIKGSEDKISTLPEQYLITDELLCNWQNESKAVGIHSSVVNAIKALRKKLAILEKEDGNQMRYYISDRRWRKAYRLMQTSAYLNGRNEINLSDFLILIHSFWNDVECIPNVLNAFTEGSSDSTLKRLLKIDKSIHQLMTTQQKSPKKTDTPGITSNNSDFAEFDYFYYLVENYPAGDTLFSKWDYSTLTNLPHDGVRYYDGKRKKNIIHILVPGRPFDAKFQNASNLTKIKIQKCANGAIIDDIPYAFRRKSILSEPSSVSDQPQSVYEKVSQIQDLFKSIVEDWCLSVTSNWTNKDNIFLSPDDLALVNKMQKEIDGQIKAIEVKINNVGMMIK